MKTSLIMLVFGILLASCAPSTTVSTQQRMTANPAAHINRSGLIDGAIVVTKNPYGVAPLTAEVVFRTTVPTRVSVEVLGNAPVKHNFVKLSMSHRVPILGLYPGTENHVRLQVRHPNAGTFETVVTVTTDPLPAYFPEIEMTTADQGEVEPGWTLSQYSVNPSGSRVLTDRDASKHLRGLPFMFDQNGAIRYYLDLTVIGGLPFEVLRLRNGNWVFGEASDVFEYSPLGKRLNRWTIPGYAAHHEIAEKPDGNLLVAVHKAGTKNKDGVFTNGDVIIELDRASGRVTAEWDLRRVADVYRRELVGDPTDWFHMNAIWYSETDDSLVVSGRNQGIFKLTRDNTLVWILAPHRGWGQAGVGADKYQTADYLLTAVDRNGRAYLEAVQQGNEAEDDFDWAWGQHAPMYLPNGNLFVFDNGFNRHFAGNEGNNFSRGVEYMVDEEAMTVRQVREYGRERGASYFSAIISDVDYLPQTGHRLIMPGIVLKEDQGYAYVTEVDDAGVVVAEAEIRFGGEFKTDSFFGEIVYRSERLPLYPN